MKMKLTKNFGMEAPNFLNHSAQVNDVIPLSDFKHRVCVKVSNTY